LLALSFQNKSPLPGLWKAPEFTTSPSTPACGPQRLKRGPQLSSGGRLLTR
jgi:hypothetical protein